MRWLSSEAAADIVSASGAVMFVRVTALREVDGFDERFFMGASHFSGDVR